MTRDEQKHKQLILTADGSHTVLSEQFGVHYHSIFGARQESEHVFIQQGLLPLIARKKQIRIFEMGFGTGLNAWLSWQLADREQVSLHYTGFEAYPLEQNLASLLNYNSGEDSISFRQLHAVEWNKDIALSEHFTCRKVLARLDEEAPEGLFDLVYYDAFAPSSQPELWTEQIFSMLYGHMQEAAVLVTYCAKGDVKRALRAAGFRVERLQGPPRKRHMLRAIKDATL